MPPPPPALRRYRLAVYVAFGAVCAVVFLQLLRGVAGDLYGQPAPASAPAMAPAACLDELDRLYQQLAARAVEPAPRSLDPLSNEWDAWSRRWEAELESAARRCRLAAPEGPALADLAEAEEALEDLRRDLGRSGGETAAEAGRARDALGAARSELFGKRP